MEPHTVEGVVGRLVEEADAEEDLLKSLPMTIVLSISILFQKRVFILVFGVVTGFVGWKLNFSFVAVLGGRTLTNKRRVTYVR